MANTSATGGYLTPTTPPPDDDIDLDVIFQGAVAGITGLAGDMVRPRWQPTEPKIPVNGTNWCGVGVMVTNPDDFPYLEHFASGKDTLKRHEEIEVMASFYGTNSARYAKILRDGLFIAQNIEQLKKKNINFVDAGDVRQFHELINNKWQKRNDITLKFRRQIVRDYDILNIEAANIHLIDDTGHVDETIQVTP